jgi:catechol 2,3-dioxygenase-like lactoylglutathione lyase family enzyme
MTGGGLRVKIQLSSVMVNDQEKALWFYTEVLGFVKKKDIPMGAARWLTVTSPEGPEGVELLLEPNEFPPAKVFQKSLFDAGIPATAFAVDDIQSEYDRLTALGVVFRSTPTKAGPATVAAFDDTCGNVIQLYEVA